MKTNDASVILGRMMKNDPEFEEMVQEATINAQVAQLIYEARTQAGLTQQQLADLIGTKQPVIARLEDGDYDGHSLSMLQRIGNALNKRLHIEFIPFEAASLATAEIGERS